MSKFTLHERAFHPDGKFGMGGLWFEGDDRGFSFITDRNRVTSRVGGIWEIDTASSQITEIDVYSDPSRAPWGSTSNYSTPETKPTGRILNSAVSPKIDDGLQAVNLRVHTRGKNQAFTNWAPINNLVVPDLDVTVHLMLQIDRHKKTMRITSTLLGDGFPNSEVFIIDSADTPIMLNTHHRIGHAAGQLIGNHGHLLAASEIEIGIDDSDNFINPITAKRCVDFMPFSRDLLAIAGTSFTIPTWNALHLARDPSEKGLLGMDTDDNLPIPGWDHEYPRDGNWGLDDFFSEPTEKDLPNWDH